MNIPRQILWLRIGGKEVITDLGFNFSGSFDMDEIAGILTFNLPYDVVETAEGQILNFKDLKKFDLVRLYFNNFEEEPEEVTIDNLKLVFDGFVDDVKLSNSKDGPDYVIECLGRLGMANYSGVSLRNEEIGGVDAFNLLLQRSGLQKNSIGEGVDYIPSSSIYGTLDLTQEGLSEDLLFKWDGGLLLKQTLDNIKERYGVRTHYQGNGRLHVFHPMAFFNTQVTVWNFDQSDNITTIDYGSLFQKYNTVVCIYGPPGFQGAAIAVDILGVQNRAESLGVGINDRESYTIFYVIRGDIEGYDNALTVAQNTLYEFTQNQVVTIKTFFNPEFKVTDFFTLETDEIYANTFFFIKKYEFSITKNDVSATLYGTASLLGAVPQNLTVGPTALTDIHTLDIEKDVTDATGWNVFDV